MAYTVLVRIGSAGPWPWMLGEEHAPPVGEEGVRWRFVASTDDEDEAWLLVGQLHAKRQHGEL